LLADAELRWTLFELSCDLHRNTSSSIPTHKPHTVRRGVLKYYIGQSDHGSMIKVWRCSRTLHARPTVATRCFTTTRARREVRSLQELPDRICAGLHGMDKYPQHSPSPMLTATQKLVATTYFLCDGQAHHETSSLSVRMTMDPYAMP
jgi:hypothetical protein